MPKTRKTMKRKTMKKRWGGASKTSKSKQKQHTAPMVGKPQKSISMKAFLAMFNALDVNPPPQPPPPPPQPPQPPPQVKDEMDMLADKMENVCTNSSRPAAKIANVRLSNSFKPKPLKNVTLKHLNHFKKNK